MEGGKKSLITLYITTVSCHNRPIISHSLPVLQTHTHKIFVFYYQSWLRTSSCLRSVSIQTSETFFPESSGGEVSQLSPHFTTEICCQSVAAVGTVRHPDRSHTSTLPGPTSFRSLSLFLSAPHSFSSRLHLWIFTLLCNSQRADVPGWRVFILWWLIFQANKRTKQHGGDCFFSRLNTWIWTQHHLLLLWVKSKVFLLKSSIH